MIQVIGLRELKKHKELKIYNAEAYTKKHYKIDNKFVPNNMMLTIYYDLRHTEKEYFTYDEFMEWLNDQIEFEGHKVKNYLWYFDLDN